MVSSVASLVFWRMRGEVQWSGLSRLIARGVRAVCGTALPTSSGLDADLRPALAAPWLPVGSWSSAGAASSGSPRSVAGIMSRPRPVPAPFRRRDRPHAPLEKSIDFQAVTLGEKSCPSSTTSGRRRSWCSCPPSTRPGTGLGTSGGPRWPGRLGVHAAISAQGQLAAQFLAPAEQRRRHGRAAAVRPAGHEGAAAQVAPGGLAGGRCHQPVPQSRFAGRVCRVPRAGTAGQALFRMLLLAGRFRFGEVLVPR